MSDWRPMSEAPKDGTPVRLRLEDMDGPYEIEGTWRWLKPKETRPARWFRASDNAEMMVLPHSWRPVIGALL